MDATELTRGKLVAAACGVILLLLMFWSWFDVSSVGGTDYSARYAAADLDTTINAWQAFAFIDVILLLTALAAIGAVVWTLVARGPAPVAPEAAIFFAGALSTLLLFFRILDPVLDAGREPGLYLGFLAAAGITAGGWMALQDSAAARRPRRRARPRPPSESF
jgi:hypothetical protein